MYGKPRAAVLPRRRILLVRNSGQLEGNDMPDLSTILIFAAACVVLTATPGPDMLLIASRSISQGRAAGFLTYAGIALGTYCHTLAAALGLSQLFVVVPAAYDAVRFAGCLYLLYLGWTTLRSPTSAFSPAATLAKLS